MWYTHVSKIGMATVLNFEFGYPLWQIFCLQIMSCLWGQAQVPNVEAAAALMGLFEKLQLIGLLERLH